MTTDCQKSDSFTPALCRCKKQSVTQQDWNDANLINIAREIHGDDPAFGYRLIADELPDRGITASENRDARLCLQEQLCSEFSTESLA